jgi:hypothetical protein
MDGLKRGWGIFVASCSFGGTWAILLFPVLLEAIFFRHFFWWKVTFFLSSFLLVLLVDCYMMHCPSLASLCLVSFGSLPLFSPVST